MKKTLALIFLTLFLTACSLLYKQDIQQGNLVTAGMLDQLKVGMTQTQVRYIAGTPVLQSTFDDNRWDYIYTYQPGHGKKVVERITLLFRDGILEKVESNIR